MQTEILSRSFVDERMFDDNGIWQVSSFPFLICKIGKVDNPFLAPMVVRPGLVPNHAQVGLRRNAEHLACLGWANDQQ